MSISENKKMLSIIVPLCNEEDNVVLLYRKLNDTLSSLPLLYEIIFIDDGSTDGTYQLLRELKSSDEKIIVIKLIRNFGQTAVLAAGFKIASGEIAITVDGDLQYDPQDIVLFLDMINLGADVVCGWRQSNNLYLQMMRIPSLIANYFGAFIFGLNVHDFSCSFRAYKKDFYKKLYLGEDMHRFIPILAKFEGMTVKEVKISAALRKRGASKYTPLRFPGVIKDAIFLKISELFFSKSCKYLFKKINYVIDDIQF